MARIKLAYIGGGSTRAPGTVASVVKQGKAFAGSEVVLVDLDPEHLEIVRSLAERMARAAGVDIRVTATTDRATHCWIPTRCWAASGRADSRRAGSTSAFR
jgi:6-phospho-beta-glucosidase